MASYLIGYDLNESDKDYPQRKEGIKAVSDTWWHYLDSTCSSSTPAPAASTLDALKSHIDANDELLVVKLSGKRAWSGFNEKGSNWLMGNL